MTQHYISVAATFEDEGVAHVPFDYVWEKFNDLAEQLVGRSEIQNVSVTCVRAGNPDPDEEYYDEHTMVKVREALQGVLRSYDLELRLADPLINEMLNAGIIFREKGPRS